MDNERSQTQAGDGPGAQSSGTASSAAGSSTAGVADTAERARQEATRLMGEAKETGKSVLTEKKQAAADEIAGVASALRKTARNLQQEGQSSPGSSSTASSSAGAASVRYAERAAEGLERLSTTIRERDLTSLFNQAEDFARRSPGVFFSGAVAAGFFITRFMKSSGDRRSAERSWQRADDDDGEYPPASYSSEMARGDRLAAAATVNDGAKTAEPSASKPAGSPGVPIGDDGRDPQLGALLGSGIAPRPDPDQRPGGSHAN